MKIKWKILIPCIAVPLLLGGLAGLISKNGMQEFAALSKPPLSPPGWLFPVVWTVLYILMGIASYLILTSGAPKPQISRAITLYGVQLLLNFFWTIWFFNLQLYYFSFVWIVAMWLMILATAISFYRIKKPAAYLMLSYLLWVTFAGYLNLGVALLN